METPSSSATGTAGLTRDAGWQIGVRRTIPVSPEAIWDVLLSDEGRAVWLGAGAELPNRLGVAYRATDGTTGDVRSYAPRRLIRLTWWPVGWDAPSTLQIRIQPAARGTILSVHQEHLANAERRSEMRDRWVTVIDRLVGLLGKDGPD